MRGTSRPRDRGSAAANWAAVLVGLPAAALAVIGIVQLVGADDEPAGDDPGIVIVDPEPIDRDGAGGAVESGAAERGATDEPDEAEESEGGSPGSGCEVVVANPLVVIHEQTDVFSQEVSGVPAGTYAVLEIETVSSPIGSQRWFRVEVDGRQGWLRDSSFDIASKSAACP